MKNILLLILFAPLLIQGAQLDSIVTKEYSGDSNYVSKEVYYYNDHLVKREYYSFKNKWCLSNYTVNEYQNGKLIWSEQYSNFNRDSIEPISRTEYYGNIVIDYSNDFGQWKESVKTEYIGDTCTIVSMYMNKWVYSHKSINRYSGSKIKEEIYYMWQNNSWQLFDRTVYNYDGAKLIEKVNYEYEVETEKTIYIYDSELLSEKVEYVKDDNFWLGENRVMYSYNDNELAQKITYNWNIRDSVKTIWSKSDKVIYEVEGNNDIQYKFIWNEIEWVNIENLIYTYDNQDSIVKVSKVYPESNSTVVEYYYYQPDLVSVKKPQNVSEVKIFPNPFTDYVMVENNDFYLSHIYNINGSLLITSDKSLINTSELSSGIYFLKHNNSITKLIKK